MTSIKDHFEHVAHNYDYWKKKNWYYYQQLKTILKEKIPPGKKVLEIGCGTGDLLAALQPLKGLGIDISENMIKIAKEKHKETKNIAFNVGKAENLTLNQEFDVILLADIIEHLENVNQMSESLTKIANSKTLIILTMINPLWEPALLLAEKFNLKMPEGPHHRLTFKELEKIFKKHHLYVLDLEYRIFIPKYLPFISDKINSTFFNIPLLRNLGLVQILTLKKV
ncbi:MAG TPA: methyltransferase domain-containing protein [Candidatus Nanoarchaeia archaeon]|nr:methyltransferase domain-containing protein [Candidatus Nanoarchaeia archaeon]